MCVRRMLRWFEHSQVYHPGLVLEADGSELGRPFENVLFHSLDKVELNSWFFPAETNSPRGQFVFLICHGNAGNISHRLSLYQALLEIGTAVFAFDYRGYGRSRGQPDEEGTYLDAQAAYQWLRRKGFAAENIIVYGESLGGGVASELCRREETGGLVLQGTFTSIPDIGSELFPWLPVRWLGSIQYDTRSKLPQLKIPVLVMHSRTDEMIGFRHAERNFAAAKEPKLFREIQGDHNNPLTDPARFHQAIEEFLRLVEQAACKAGEQETR
jgi:pimeloyl-ACP methyl ester carboxylesterase